MVTTTTTITNRRNAAGGLFRWLPYLSSAAALLLLLLLPPAAFTDAADTCRSNRLEISPLVKSRRDGADKALTFGHRGASSHLPEHTLGAYRLALELGADYIQPDILATSDGKLVAVHQADLNSTTDVATVFPDRIWYSEWVDRESYWVFNFTLKEIQQLKLTQQIDGRATMYDKLFRIPTLDEILRVLNKWNTADLPLIYDVDDMEDGYDDNEGYSPSRLELVQAGLSLELKDSAWLLEEAGLDLNILLLDHMDQNPDLWRPLQQCYADIPYDQYKVPPLVLQSFNADSLNDFRDLWVDSNYNQQVAEPKYILMTDDEDCWEDEFWADISRDYKSFLSAIAVEKVCLLNDEKGPYFMDKARENNLIVHAYTERPEQDYLDWGRDSLEETQFLICVVGVAGIFSESVSTAVLASTLPCPVFEEDDGASAMDDHAEFCAMRPSSGLYVGLVSFVAGIVVAVGGMYCWIGRRTSSTSTTTVVSSSYHDNAASPVSSPQQPSSDTYPESNGDNEIKDHPGDEKYIDAFNEKDDDENGGDADMEMTSRRIV